MIFLLRGHSALKRKDLQTAQQKLSERQRRGIHIKAWGNAPGLWECKTPALKARFTLPELSRAFSPWPSELIFWGVARG
jgi:hypothetical protein